MTRFAELAEIASDDACEHCGRTLRFDSDDEVYLDSADGFECAAAPRKSLGYIDRRTGSEATYSGCHVAA